MTTSTIVLSQPAPDAGTFRTCQSTGRQIDLGAERLVKAHAVASVVALLIGAIAAVLIVLTRWQAVHLLPAEWFYRILGVHGMSMITAVTAWCGRCSLSDNARSSVACGITSTRPRVCGK